MVWLRTVSLAFVAILAVACGPALIGVGLASNSSGGGGGVAPNDASLRGLTISSAELLPAFQGQVLDYTATTVSSVASVSVTAVAANPGAEIVVDGSPVIQGVPSLAVALTTGIARTFTITVTSVDRTSVRNYTVTTTRQAAPLLTGLHVSDGRADVPLDFDPGTNNYSLELGFLTPSVLITPTAPPDASLEIRSTPIPADGPLTSGETRTVSLRGDEQNTVTIEVAKGQGALREVRDYVLTIFRQSVNALEQRAYVKADNRDAGDQFGSTLALSGDLLAVGAPSEDSNVSGVHTVPSPDNSLTDSGAVYVYEAVAGSPPGWNLEAFLKASAVTNAADANFGASIALQGDLLAVGAPGVDSGRGMVFVYHRLPAGGWDPNADLVTAGAFRDANDRFGQAIALDGDTLVVGARGEDSGLTGVGTGGTPDNSRSASGAAYVFVRSGSQWNLQAFLKASNTDQSDLFGHCVAISGDTIAVGAPQEDSPSTTIGGSQGNSPLPDLDSGAVYVFRRNGGVWAQEQYLKGLFSAFAPFEQGGRFGNSVALSGSTLVVGASLDNGPEGVSAQAGAVYVFVDQGGWNLQQHILPSNLDDGDEFGTSVALYQDTLVVGAPKEDGPGTLVGTAGGNGAFNSGAAYVFLRNQGLWQQGAYVKASNTQVSDTYGQAVAVFSKAMAVGAPNEDGSSAGVTLPPSWPPASSVILSSGAVYVLN